MLQIRVLPLSESVGQAVLTNRHARQVEAMFSQALHASRHGQTRASHADTPVNALDIDQTNVT